jgi:LAO/AO transport system kinase
MVELIMEKNKLIELLELAKNGEKFPIAKIISEIEKKNSIHFRKLLFQTLKEMNLTDSRSITIGITGTPGAGKSSLIGQICTDFLDKEKKKKMAIVAIDPSSNTSGGSILGDRTRVTIPNRENRLFFRSQASQLEMGGVNPYTFHVIRFLRSIFEYVLIETVGIGQNEIEVTNLTDFSFLVMQPLGGDQIQFMKSGIMEVPDAFIINKCDEKSLAMSSYHTLLSSLEFLKDITKEKAVPKILLTSVLNRIGIDELLTFIFSIQSQKPKLVELELQIKRWIKNEYGNFGLNLYMEHFSQKENITQGFEEKEEEFKFFFETSFKITSRA